MEGGTALNLFVQDMLRLFIDIDVIYYQNFINYVFIDRSILFVFP